MKQFHDTYQFHEGEELIYDGIKFKFGAPTGPNAYQGAPYNIKKSGCTGTALCEILNAEGYKLPDG